MGQKDLGQIDFFDNNFRFADACNGILFKGETVIHPSELEECDSVLVQFLHNQKGKKVITDKIKKWKGQHLALFILESQSNVDYRMVLRFMLEEVMAYEKQRKIAYTELKQSGYKFRGSEYTSRMKKDQKFIPIIPVVIYLGKNSSWDAATTLYDLLEIDEELKPFVNNYKLNFYNYNNETDFSIFKTELRLLFEILSARNDKNKMIQLLTKECEKYKIGLDTATALKYMAELKIDLEKLKVISDGEEEYKMCKAIEELQKDYRNEGYKSGLDEGYNIALKESVKSLMNSLNVSLEQALDLLNIEKTIREKLYL